MTEVHEVEIRYTGTYPLEITLPHSGLQGIIQPGETVKADAREVDAWDDSPRPWERVTATTTETAAPIDMPTPAETPTPTVPVDAAAPTVPVATPTEAMPDPTPVTQATEATPAGPTAFPFASQETLAPPA